MVRSAKTALTVSNRSQTVTDTVLQMLLTKVEQLMNVRALTANSDDPNNLQPLTPAHFLMQRRTVCLPPGIFEKADAYHRKKWRQVQLLADLFYKRWLREYLPTLQTRGKWHKALTNLKPYALVLLVNDNVLWGRWNLGQILETCPGPDGLVRVAKVKTTDAGNMSCYSEALPIGERSEPIAINCELLWMLGCLIRASQGGRNVLIAYIWAPFVLSIDISWHLHNRCD